MTQNRAKPENLTEVYAVKTTAVKNYYMYLPSARHRQDKNSAEFK